jgi:hypothetical protein
MLGKIHSVETKALLSKAKLGIPLTELHKLKISDSRNKGIYVYTIDLSSQYLILYLTFKTSIEAMKFFNCSRRMISNYLDKNKLYKKQ